MSTIATNGSTPETGVPLDQAASASVAIDVGVGRGALVIYPAERFREREIEISRTDGHGHRVHTGVHERSTHAGAVLTAVFGSVAAGDYVVWKDASTAGPTVRVPEGAIAELELS
jgi:hypothetical protein